MQRVAIYLLDQDKHTTASLGIFHYTQHLIRDFVKGQPPGFALTLWVSQKNRDDFVPSHCPDWVQVRCLPGSFGTGWRRLVADHILTIGLVLWDRPRAIHFPKGFMPFWLPFWVRRITTIHDTIIPYYRENYPNYFPRIKTAYLQYVLRRSYRHAEQVIAVSHFSSDCLRKIYGERASVHVIPSFGFCRPASLEPPEQKEGIFVMGSCMPHKATAEALRRLEMYAQATGVSERITVSGVRSLDEIPGLRQPCSLPVDIVGRLSYAVLLKRLAASRALVVMSEIEGFGLPLLEAYAVGTPVVFRNVASMREILEGIPGGWDGASDRSFCEALDACLSMPASEIGSIQRKLALRYDWSKSVNETRCVYQTALGQKGA